MLVPSQILNEEITPTLRKLKEERSSYLEYQKVMRELEHLSRLSIAFQFVQAEVRGAGQLDTLIVLPEIEEKGIGNGAVHVMLLH